MSLTKFTIFFALTAILYVEAAAIFDDTQLLDDATILEGSAESVRQMAPGANYDAYSQIQAENFTETGGASYGVDVSTCLDYSVNDTYRVGCVVGVANGDYVGYSEVDFGTGAERVSFRFNSYEMTNGQRGLVHWILDSPDGVPFHTTTVGNTQTYNMVTKIDFLDYTPAARDVHDLFLLFETTSTTPNLIFIDWFQFF